MKNLIKITLCLSVALFTLGSLSACGQKGPLKIDQPPVKTQTEELEETK